MKRPIACSQSIADAEPCEFTRGLVSAPQWGYVCISEITFARASGISLAAFGFFHAVVQAFIEVSQSGRFRWLLGHRLPLPLAGTYLILALVGWFSGSRPALNV